MLPRMMIGDYLFVAKWPYGYSRFSMPFGLGSFDGRIWARCRSAATSSCSAIPAAGDEDFVKRVIGLPGDTVQMRGGAALILNGKPVPKCGSPTSDAGARPTARAARRSADAARADRHGRRATPLLRLPRYRETLPGGRSYEVLDQIARALGPRRRHGGPSVPAGHYFMMGDNRDDSDGQPLPPSRGGVGCCRSTI
jgi:signal peptidase I